MRDPNPVSIPPHPLPGEEPLFPPNRPPTLTATAGPPVEPRRPAMGEVRGEMARGGVLIVLRERCPAPVRLIALDFLLTRPPDAAGDWPRLLREAAILAHLQYPDLVPLYEVGEHAGQPYLTAWLVEGSHARPWTEMAPVLARLAKAVHDAHQDADRRTNLHPARVVLDADVVPALTTEGPAERGPGAILRECLADPGPRLDGERQVVALKGADRAPGQSGASAAELTAEVERWLRNGPVQACLVALGVAGPGQSPDTAQVKAAPANRAPSGASDLLRPPEKTDG
jgi:hypothetical protein